MHPKSSGSLKKRSQQKVLVLGEKANAGLISEQLQEEGFETVFLSSLTQGRLPSVVDPKSLAEMRALIAQFASVSQNKGMIHPGTTIWAERPELPSLAQQVGLTVISPPPGILSYFSNKLNLLSDSGLLGIPNLVQRWNPMHSAREIEDFIRKNHQPFPFTLRSAKGGGRFGQFLVLDASSLGRTLELWCDQLRRAQGEVILFAERYIEGARTVSLPFARFQDGQAQIFPFLDSSLQSLNRKVIEFCPASRISQAVRKQLADWTLRLAARCGYVGVGVLQFLVDSSRAFLLDGLPRLDTSFYLWNQVSGTRAIAWQLATLNRNSQETLPPMKLEKSWVPGMSFRVYAEDLFHLPQPGVVQELSEERNWTGPKMAETRVFLSYEKGDRVSTEDSGLFATFFVAGQTRKELLAAAQNVLGKFWVAGSLQTNERFLLELMGHPWLREGIFHSGFVDEEFLPVMRPPVEYLKICASIGIEMVGVGEGKRRWAMGDQWVKQEDIDPTFLRWNEGPAHWQYQEKRGVSGSVELSENDSVRVCAFPLSSDRWIFRLGSWFLSVRVVTLPKSPELKPRPKLSALVSGRIHAILFRPGTQVAAHETLLVIESMGVFIPHALPIAAKVLRWHVNAEDGVEVGQILAEISIETFTSN